MTLAKVAQRWLTSNAGVLDGHLQEGRFQRSLSAAAGFAGLMSGLEVTLQHYRGSYNQRVMYSPVVLGAMLFGAGMAGAASPRIARTVLPVVAGAMLVDGVVGFGFHIRGIARKPGGWRLPVFNVVMGPPVFAPLLLGIGGFMGVLASMLQPEEGASLSATTGAWTTASRIREGRFQRALAGATAASAALNGVEALYSHYKTGFRYRAQWIPVVISPPLAAAGVAAIFSEHAARYVLAPLSILAGAAGAIGVFYHARGVVRRPGGLKQPLHNLTYGPPLFAPLLFSASGLLGLLTSGLRRTS